MRVEQRIGRIDRFGQRAKKIFVVNLFAQGTIDARIYRKLFERLDIFRTALGELEPVLGELEATAADLVLTERTPEEEEAVLEQTVFAAQNRRNHEEQLESEAALLTAHQDYILRNLNEVKDLSRALSREDIRSFILDFFRDNYPGTTAASVEGDDAALDILLSSDCQFDFSAFLRDKGLSFTTRLLSPSVSPVRCRIDTRVGINTRVEEISHFHPLIRFIAHRIAIRGLSVHPAITAVVRASSLRGIGCGTYVFAVQRWSFGGARTEERLHFAACRVDSVEPLGDDAAERLINSAALYSDSGEDLSASVDMVAAAIQLKKLLDFGAAAHDRYYVDLNVRAADRAEVQCRVLTAFHNEEKARLEELVARYEREGSSLRNAVRGKITRLTMGYERRREELERGRRILRESPADLAVGIIEVRE
jgi:hypothetical protein